VLGKHIIDIPLPVDDSYTLIFQCYDRTRPSNSGKGHHKCGHCGKLGHKIDRCYALHGRPPRSVVVAQNVPLQPSTMDLTSSDISGQPSIFNEFLKWYEDRQNSGSTTSVSHSGTSYVGLTHSNSLVLGFLTQMPPIILLVINLFSLLCLPSIIYHSLPWPMALRSHPMVLVLFIIFFFDQLIMFFMFLGLFLTYYSLVV